MRKLTLICALAIVFAIGSVASAEVQSIRVSGEVNTYGIYRNDDNDLDYFGATAGSSNPEQFIETTVGLNFDADLTENVAAHLGMISQRDWDNGTGTNNQEWDVSVAQAYITLNEMLYEPLTVRIGTQPLYFGRGLIIGSTVNDDYFDVDPQGALGAPEYTLHDNSFDSISATLDYAPWAVDLGYVKVDEGANDQNDDHTVWFINGDYDFENEYAAELEGYFLYDKLSRQATQNKTNDLFTIGARGSFVPLEDSLVFGEIAYQFGNIMDTPLSSSYYVADRSSEVDVDAIAYEIGGSYFWEDVLIKPEIGATYTFMQGDPRGNDGDYEGFTSPYMRKSDTAIFGWNGRLYDSAITQTSRSPWYTNLQQILLTLNMKPLAAMDYNDINLEAKYAHFEYDESPKENCDDDAGNEVDLMLTYDYTEDVQFGLLSAWFMPGEFYSDAETEDTKSYDETIYEVVGSCKVTF
jgi:hypothetical protein